ncbi:hypothetical protein EV368DRAFT_69117 [Lentinula lateritia]|nr:hypothetical protein EV368DRAFT_69117 [Lentinula lateritia]
MSSSPLKAPSHASPACSSLPHSSSREEVATSLDSNGEVEQDQLAFMIESPSTPQLQIFKNVFNTGKPLASYYWDDPLWPTLAAVAVACSNCTKHPDTCKVPLDVPSALPVILGTAWYLGSAATKVLVELSMLDEQDSRAIDRSELQRFQQAQEQEALLAAKQKRVNISPQPRVRSKKRRVTKTAKEPVSSKTAAEEVP